MYPETDRKMRFSRIKQMLHSILHILRYVSKPGMVDPVLRGIFGERKSRETVSGDEFPVQA